MGRLESDTDPQMNEYVLKGPTRDDHFTCMDRWHKHLSPCEELTIILSMGDSIP